MKNLINAMLLSQEGFDCKYADEENDATLLYHEIWCKNQYELHLKRTGTIEEPVDNWYFENAKGEQHKVSSIDDISTFIGIG